MCPCLAVRKRADSRGITKDREKVSRSPGIEGPGNRVWMMAIIDNLLWYTDQPHVERSNRSPGRAPPLRPDGKAVAPSL